MLSPDPDFKIEITGAPKGVPRVGTRVIVSKKTGRHVATRFTPTAQRNEMAFIRELTQNAMIERKPFSTALNLKLVAYMPIPKSFSTTKRQKAIAGIILPTVKPDFDNIAKYIDAMKGVAFTDDALITDAHVWKRYSERPRVVIELRVIPAVEPAY